MKIWLLVGMLGVVLLTACGTSTSFRPTPIVVVITPQQSATITAIPATITTTLSVTLIPSKTLTPKCHVDSEQNA
jgi:uncharacterized lipoprotein YbaY